MMSYHYPVPNLLLSRFHFSPSLNIFDIWKAVFYWAFPCEAMDSAELLFGWISPWRGGSPNRGGSFSRLYVHVLCLFVCVCLNLRSVCACVCVCVCVCETVCQCVCVMYCISSRVAFLTGRPCRTQRALAALKSPCRTAHCFSCLTENHGAARGGTSGCEWTCRHEDTEQDTKRQTQRTRHRQTQGYKDTNTQ